MRPNKKYSHRGHSVELIHAYEELDDVEVWIDGSYQAAYSCLGAAQDAVPVLIRGIEAVQGRRRTAQEMSRG